MKKTILLSMALGLASAASLSAGTVEVFLTGSTAFRANVYNACTKLFSPAASVYYGDSTHGGDANFNSSTASWVMTGTPITGLTNVYGVGNLPSGTTLKIHGLFTGSIQGIQTVEQGVQLVFPKDSGTAGGAANAYVTNTPTIGFSDASGASAPYTANAPFVEENVCVQPFVMVKSKSTNNVMTNINNVSWEQMEYGIPKGRIPLSAWTANAPDTNTFIYLCQRSSDSGTRRCETAQLYYSFQDPVNVYIYDYTNNFWFTPTVLAATTFASSPNGVVGAPGLNGVNLNWGYGYVGGGDIKNSLNNANSNNLSMSYLSINDAKGVGASNWANVVSFNGLWPTTAGAGIQGNTVTNNYAPIINGYYPCWGNEVVVYSTAQSGISDSKVTDTQMGTGTTPGTFMGIFNAHTATPTAGSIDNEIFLSQSVGGVGYPATAIRLNDMKCNRAAVGGTISPF